MYVSFLLCSLYACSQVLLHFLTPIRYEQYMLLRILPLPLEHERRRGTWGTKRKWLRRHSSPGTTAARWSDQLKHQNECWYLVFLFEPTSPTWTNTIGIPIAPAKIAPVKKWPMSWQILKGKNQNLNKKRCTYLDRSESDISSSPHLPKMIFGKGASRKATTSCRVSDLSNWMIKITN